MSSERTFPAPEISRYRVGEFAVTVLSDGSLDASLDLLDGIDQDEALSLLGAADTSPSSHMNINAFVIEAGARTILIGGGAGNLNGWGGRLILALIAAGYQCHVNDRGVSGRFRKQPVLDFQDDSVAMSQVWDEMPVLALIVPGWINQQITGRLQHDGRPEQSLGQSQGKIRPGHDAANRQNVTIIHQQAIRIDPDGRESLLQSGCGAPVRGGRSSVQQAGGGEEECPGTNSRQDAAAIMAGPQPRQQIWNSLGGGRSRQAGGNDHDRRCSRQGAAVSRFVRTAVCDLIRSYG